MARGLIRGRGTGRALRRSFKRRESPSAGGGIACKNTGVNDATQNLKRRAVDILDLTPVTKEGARMIEELIDNSFRNQTAPDGTPWEDLADSTLKGRIAKSLGGKGSKRETLRNTWGGSINRVKSAGRRAAGTRKNRYEYRVVEGKKQWTLKKRYVEKAYKLAFGGIQTLIDTGRLRRSFHAIAKPQSIEFGSNVDYMPVHQAGTKPETTPKIPRRMIAPAELVGGKWQLVMRGPAGEVFRLIRQMVVEHIG